MLAFFERTVYKKHPMADGTVHLNIIFRGAILAVIAKCRTCCWQACVQYTWRFWAASSS